MWHVSSEEKAHPAAGTQTIEFHNGTDQWTADATIAFADANDTNIFRAVKFGWGGRIRTFTVLINSEVSYQLDHAPFLFHINMQTRTYCMRVTSEVVLVDAKSGAWLFFNSCF